MPNPEDDLRRQQLGAKTDGLDELPELKFQRVDTSEKKIVDYLKKEGGGEIPEIRMVKHYGNYTAVVLGDNKVLFFDQKARLEPISEEMFASEIGITWSEFGGGLNKLLNVSKKFLVGPELNESDDDMGVESLPVYLRNIGEIGIGKGSMTGWKGRYKSFEDSVPIMAEFGSIVDVIESGDGRHILLRDDAGLLIVLATYNKAGVKSQPRNWRRFDSAHLAEAPKELQEFAEQTLNAKEHLREFDDGLITAEIGEKGGVFRRRGAPIDQSFADNVPKIENNICVDRKNPKVLYYCSSEHPDSIFKLDTSADPKTWLSVEAQFPNKYGTVEGLQFDPTGNFFVFTSGSDIVILRSDTLVEVGRRKEVQYPRFGEDGNLRCIDKNGNFVIESVNFDEVAQGMAAAKVARAAANVTADDIFAPETVATMATIGAIDKMKQLEPLRDKYTLEGRAQLAAIKSVGAIIGLRYKLDAFKLKLRGEGFQPEQAEFLASGLQEELDKKVKELSLLRSTELIGHIETRIASGMTFAAIADMQKYTNELLAMEPSLDEATRKDNRLVLDKVEQAIDDVYKRDGEIIVKDINEMFSEVEIHVKSFTMKSEFDDWAEFVLPGLKRQLASQLINCSPVKAPVAYKAIMDAKTRLVDLEQKFTKQFAEQYSEIRERASAKMDAVAAMIGDDIGAFLERLSQKGFKRRVDGEAYIQASEAETEIRVALKDFARQQPDKAKDLERKLNVGVANTLAQIERGGTVVIDETGAWMEQFGSEQFPIWAAAVAKQEKQHVGMRFKSLTENEVDLDKIRGNIELMIKMPDGSKKFIRLYEGMMNEDEMRSGMGSYRGERLPRSLMTGEEFMQFKKEYTEWSKTKSKLRAEYEKLRDAMRQIYEKRANPSKGVERGDEAWQSEYKAALEAYGTFCAEHRVALLQRIDAVENGLVPPETNGKGLVPEPQGHWVVDAETDKNLESMAKWLKMQFDLKEGILNLYGHAGTGKDVLVKMFCARTKRPYFSTDCTKWTTEFELGEDVALDVESTSGATKTIRIPSSVLRGIQTPGAVVYFNELNGMPEQSQIFLHALFDEKRSLTLKTSGGQVVKADPSVLFISSMNPGYKGTFDPQFATKSRMVDMEIGYPPLYREPDAGDANTKNKPYNSSEALRIAREVDSLESLTYDPIPAHNAFIKLWDKQVNKIKNNVPEPTIIQKFDLKVVLALVQFANRLRDEFIKGLENEDDDTYTKLDVLPVVQPITSRELRRCAYLLNKMTDAQKATADPEDTARKMIDDIFSAHIYSKSKRTQIKTAMGKWRSAERAVA